MATTKQSTKKSSARSKKAPAKSTSSRVRRVRSDKVDYYPNKVAFGVASLAAVLLLLLAFVAGT